mgnify:CR=1 FL=1
MIYCKDYNTKKLQYKNTINHKNTVIMNNDHTSEEIKNIFYKVAKVLKQLKEDNITWCKGIIIDGEVAVELETENYTVINEVYIWNIVVMFDDISPRDINMRIKSHGDLFLFYR